MIKGQLPFYPHVIPFIVAVKEAGIYSFEDGEYPDECLDIIEELEELELNQQPIAIFGSGDTSYPDFCGALDQLKLLIEKQGGISIIDPLKIEFNPDPKDEAEIRKFVSVALSKLK
ncbi:flavodoxin domain-containing protein [Peribacillus alkalitolerans]|uniref:flavodoxin domain-containing protein n=1 Tax=Peribacillus alkalitolerans TaxID=1550385 RepID=UPI0013D0FE9C|nr:flavodoxin domain-containing protein [Peribacillus alkalitolerans]